MGKQDLEEEKNNMDASKPPTQNGVIISVYVESPKAQSPLRMVPVKKTKPKPVSKKPQTTRKRVSDRRAQLLAYTRELRTASPQEVQIQLPRNNLKAKPKKKWKWIMAPASICIPSRQKLERTSSRWRYKRVPIIGENAEKTDPSFVSESIGVKKRKGTTKRSNSHFFNKLRCRLRELSC